VGRKVEKWLKENGYDVKAVRDINPIEALAKVLICHPDGSTGSP
jgi:hypothetical protein